MGRDRVDARTDASTRGTGDSSDTGATDGAARLTGELLVELGRKIAEFGERAVRIVTVDEMEREQVVWFRLGWEEHARHAAGEPPAPPAQNAVPARLLTFPERAPDLVEEPRHDRYDDAVEPGTGGPAPLPTVPDANVRDLMPHRPAWPRGTTPPPRPTARPQARPAPE
ncbi:hypothetical protein V2W30_21010 [Streptomyces sp. Q6]|uniref:Uncharacterized protein n=1 Tax=Streptomyces citrinus TaxID=3118173 RepID=A0ACD5AF87_9ACTN